MADLNLADALETIAGVRGSADALIQGDRAVSWRDFNARATNLAAWMLGQGAGHQGKVAVYTYNHIAYNEAVFAAFKAALVPVNVNYRYRERELAYLLDNADTEIVVVHEDFAPLLAKVLSDLPKIKGVLVLADGSVRGAADLSSLQGGVPAVADFEDTACTDRDVPDVRRSPDDLLLIYTGGTTGMPKGVMWRQGDLYEKLGGGGTMPSPPTSEDLARFVENASTGLQILVGPPLMHGTGWFTALTALLAGGGVILLPHPQHFDPAEFWHTVGTHRPNAASIVGDSFAKPLLRELDREGADYDISSLVFIASSGVMWSKATKEGLLRHHPRMMLIDVLSSSEALGTGQSVTTATSTSETGKFVLSETTRIFDENLEPLETTPGAQGLVGVGKNQPIGYYKDEAKTRQTFVDVDGVRFSVPGDWAVVEEDGITLRLLGRGSVCINTGGEKVFPEEVEEVIKSTGQVADVVVVGVPDETWGEAITAVVSPMLDDVDTEEIKRYVHEHLAAYKAPKNIVVLDEVYRSPSGKADYERTRQEAMDTLGIQA